MSHFCSCKDCKKARKEGLILGTRYMGFWHKNNGVSEYYYGPVSAYVPFPKFMKGKKRKEKKIDIE